MSKDTLLVGKLKECIQEAVVFLRTLGDFKIPAVVERRRKELLVKLEDVQGDTRREKPPKFEGSPEKDVATPPVVKKTAEQTKAKESEKEKTPPAPLRSGSVSSSSTSVTSPSRRDSKINSLVSGFETLHATAKKEEDEQTPKKWQVELRKTKKPADFPGEENEQQKEATDEKQENEEKPTEKADHSMQESNELKLNAHDGSTLSLDSTGSNDHDAPATPKTKKKHKLGGLGGLAKKIRGGRDKSPAPTRKEEPAPPAETVESEDTEQVEAEPEEVEEGLRVKGKLEHKVKSLLQTKYIMKDVKLKETTLYIGDKESVSMLGCTVQASGPGFELFSHSTQKSYTFKVTEGGDEGKEKWITAIQAAIDEVTPKEEEPSTESNSADIVPSIQVSEPVSPPTTAPEPPANDKSNKRRESKQLEVKKPVKNLPTQEVIKGYIYRKKPGITSRWEKTYCVVTHTALYFTDVEGSSEYEQMFQVVAGEAVFSEKDKGHDKNSKSVLIKMGKKTEQLSIDKKEFSNWWTVMQQAYCFGESLELEEEEEEDTIPEEPIDEDLYEEVGAAPPVPSSPRPGRPHIAEVPPEDDLIIDEDIYEDTDDFLPQSQASEYQQPITSVSAPPHLPDRNQASQPKLPPRNALANQPQLPPRNAPSQPQLPPRNTGPPLPSRVELPKKPVDPIPPLSADDEELYDDVVVQEPDQDTYDDVVVGGDEVEDTYDDVTVAPTASEPITEEFYEDMAPGQSLPQEDYVVMEHGNGEEDDDGELYVDVDHDPTPVHVAAAPPPAPSPTPKSASPKPTKGSTFARVFAGRKSSTVQAVHSGHVSYRGPKKSKFEDKFATVEDMNLCVYKASSDKKPQEKIPLGDCALELGSTEAGAGQHALRIIKGGKVHHFSLGSKEDEGGWVEVLKKLVKYAPVNLGDQQIFQSTEDHIAETDGQLTFKKGSFIRLISKDDDTIWFGQLGNEAQVFDGKTGKFPASKVVLADDLYI